MSPSNTRSNSLQPSRSSGTHFSCSSDQFTLPASIASRPATAITTISSSQQTPRRHEIQREPEASQVE
jgi:hypothetical protein